MRAGSLWIRKRTRHGLRWKPRDPFPRGKKLPWDISLDWPVHRRWNCYSIIYGFVPAEKNPVDSYRLKKGGDDVLQLHEWSTTLEEDRKVLEMLSGGDVTRIRLKEAYSNE